VTSRTSDLAHRSRRGLFLTGTDTGVGKTTIAAAILRHARNHGRQLIPFKPAETGCDPEPADALRLWEAARPPVSRGAVCLYPLPLPAAPYAAAQRAGIVISLPAILERADQLGARGDGLVVEGAGGLLVPYGPQLTGADLAVALGLPVLLVARTALGTINHVALSVGELRRRPEISLAGIILVDTVPGKAAHHESNLPLIEGLTGIRPLGIFPHIDTPDADRLALALAETLCARQLGELGL
jgi:dethiobiotin synthetase